MTAQISAFTAALFGQENIALAAQSSSSPCALVPNSSSPTKSGLVPLGAARTVLAMERRAVNFSPCNHTKIFNSDDSILPCNENPPSIRSYEHAQSDLSSPSSSATPLLFRSTPPPSSDASTPRGILRKRRIDEIRIASSVEEGTMRNKEAARLLVTGTRPRLLARDSFQLAMIRRAAGDVQGDGEKPEEVPGSDDSTSSEDMAEQGEEEGSEEEEEQVEQDGALATASLVGIILDGAEDLLTLEEAYNTLTVRLQQHLPSSPSEAVLDDIKIATRPLRDEAPAMVRAIQRDLNRLLGKLPGSPDSSSPFRALQPLQDSTPVNRSRFTPSPTPPNKSPKARQGYTESEVRYRRESSGVGGAVLRFLGLAFQISHLYTCFSEADLQAILDLVVSILRTPRLPTPNPKRTYYLALMVIAGMQIPQASVAPLQEKISRALDCALNDNLGIPKTPGAKDTGPIKKCAFQAVVNLLNTYSSTFFPHFADLLPPCLKSLVSPQPLIRAKAAAAVAAFAYAKYSLWSQTLDRQAFIKLKATAQRLEVFTISHFKSPIRGKMLSSGEKRTEWSVLEQVLKDTVTTDVYWACATWSIIVSLIGSSYASSGLSSSIDYIMDRSLQATTNFTRPLLARIAWCHAIHAYFSSGSATSVSDGRMIRSYRPFVASQDFNHQLPVDLALATASAPDSYRRVLNANPRFNDELRYCWERVEKSRKVAWISTCGTTAASVVYAYMGTALHHEDQPAREISAISGLPSSDGVPVPESALLEAQTARLDKAWEKVVRPMLKSLFTVHGVDKLKLHGWALLDALTRGETVKWSLERLLFDRFLSGELLGEKEKDNTEMLGELEKECISPAEVPSFPRSWIVSHLDKLLDLFQDALEGIGGVSELYARESITLAPGIVFPVTLSRVWSSILRALATVKDDSETYSNGLRLITRHLCQIFNRDPANHLPLSLMAEGERWTVDLESTRILIFNRLLEMTYTILGAEAISLPLLSGSGDEVDNAMAKIALGADANGSYSMAGALLSLIMASRVFTNIQPTAREDLTKVIRKLLEAGCVSGSRFLGDTTNRLHGAFEEQEDIQLDLWRLLARKWSSIVDTHTTANSTNHTGALLVSLLSNPFRGRKVTSSWHQHANEDDLSIWQQLLAATVARFRAKRVGSNLGVLESLAGHLGDFLREAEKTSSTTITLACLASATSYISFGVLAQHHESHFSLNENFVPVEFLSLVSTALFESYPQAETLEAFPASQAVSPGVYDLLKSLDEVVQRVPIEFAWAVVEPVKEGISAWFADESRIATTHAAELDERYISIITALGKAVSAHHLPATPETLNLLVDLYAPRLSRAQSRAVPQAFRAFWQLFGEVDASKLSEDVRGFLESVLAAVPGLVDVTGLPQSQALSEEESMAQYPHAHELTSVPPTPTVEPPQDMKDEVLLEAETTAQYDADVSQSVATQPVPSAVQDVQAQSPSPSETESERYVSEEVSSVDDKSDVFGPAEIAQPRGGKRRRGKGKASASRTAKKQKRQLENDAVTSAIPAAATDIDDCIVVSPDIGAVSAPAIKPDAAKPRLPSLSSFISKVGGWISPSRPEVVANDKGPDTASSSGQTRKASRVSALTRSHSEPDMSGSSRRSSSGKRKVPVVEMTTRSNKRSRGASESRLTPVEVVNVDDNEEEEDELLLSPESARKRREEERQAIQAAREKEAEATQESSGRYDDAPESSRSANVDASPSRGGFDPSPARTSQQTRILSMVEEAARAKSTIDKLNFEDLISFMRNVEELRGAAQANLQSRAERGRRRK